MNENEWVQLTIALGVFLGGIVITVINARRTRQSQSEEVRIAGGNSLIDQLQEELKTLRERMDRMDRRDRTYLPHILQLNATIERLGCTPPLLPRILQDYLDGKDEG